ncbi:unnamed protein product [Caenorhabditis auriculariae]|uniref:Uncharacterized protein n=1 Tax=Caenorhabditis auriculariae TaxID=2777116 RepID=A0A8S1HE57_9PELO|nr:unnamed protein product [Caenorhabditis auriculariae]
MSSTVCPTYQKSIFISGMNILFYVQTPILAFMGYCILFKSSAAMATFKKMLFHQVVWLQISGLIMGILVIPVMCTPVGATSFNGFLNVLGISPIIQYYLYFCSVGGVVASTMALLENRFHMSLPPYSICKLPNKVRYVWFIVRSALLINLGVPIIVFAEEDMTNTRNQYIAQYPCVAVELQRKEIFMFPQSISGPLKYFNQVVVFICVIEMFIYIFGAYWTLGKSCEKLQVSENTRKLQRRYFKAILIQELVPWLLAYMPKNMISIFGTLTAQTSLNMNNLSTFLMTAHGIWSSITLLILIKPYRDFIRKSLGIRPTPKPVNLFSKSSATHSQITTPI